MGILVDEDAIELCHAAGYNSSIYISLNERPDKQSAAVSELELLEVRYLRLRKVMLRNLEVLEKRNALLLLVLVTLY
jgi:microcystin degradation protein MlrC